MSTYKGARLKIKRADKHIAEAESTIGILKDRLVCTANVNPETGGEFIKCDFKETSDRDSFDELATVIGDAIHNLKCALDHAWLETATRLIPTRNWERTKFPCFLERNELEAALRKLQIDTSSPNFFNLILNDIKPYDRGDFAIRTIHELDLRDKHRLLIPVVHYSSIGRIYLEDESGMLHKGETWGTTQPLPHFVPFIRGLHVKEPGSASFEVMFQYGSAERETRAVDTLRLYSQHISRVVELLEEFRES